MSQEIRNEILGILVKEIGDPQHRKPIKRLRKMIRNSETPEALMEARKKCKALGRSCDKKSVLYKILKTVRKKLTPPKDDDKEETNAVIRPMSDRQGKILTEPEKSYLKKGLNSIMSEDGWSDLGFKVGNERIAHVMFGDTKIPVIGLHGRAFCFLQHIQRLVQHETGVGSFSAMSFETSPVSHTWWGGHKQRFKDIDKFHDLMSQMGIVTMHFTAPPNNERQSITLPPNHPIKYSIYCRLQRLLPSGDTSLRPNNLRDTIYLVEIDTKNKTVENIKKHPSVLFRGTGVRDLWSDVRASWYPVETAVGHSNLHKVIHDVVENSASFSTSFAEVMRVLTIPSYHETVSTPSTPKKDRQTLKDNEELEDDLDDDDNDDTNHKITNIQQLWTTLPTGFDSNFIRLWFDKETMNRSDFLRIYERSKQFDDKMYSMMEQMKAEDTYEEALANISYLRIAHKKMCYARIDNPSAQRCEHCTVLYQQLNFWFYISSDWHKESETTDTSKVFEFQQRIHRSQFLNSKNMANLTTIRSYHSETRRLFCWILKGMKKYGLLEDFEPDLSCVFFSTSFVKVVKFWLVHSSLNKGKTGKSGEQNERIVPSTLNKKKNAVLQVFRAIGGNLFGLIRAVERQVQSTTDKVKVIELIRTYQENESCLRDISTPHNGPVGKTAQKGEDSFQKGRCPEISEIADAERCLRDWLTVDNLDDMDVTEATQNSMMAVFLGFACRGLAGRNNHYMSFNTGNIFQLCDLNKVSRHKNYIMSVGENMTKQGILDSYCCVWVALSPEDASLKCSKWKKTILGMSYQTSLAIMDHCARLVYKTTQDEEDQQRARDFLLYREDVNHDVQKSHKYVKDLWENQKWSPLSALRRIDSHHRFFYLEHTGISYREHTHDTIDNLRLNDGYSKHIRNLFIKGMKQYHTLKNHPEKKKQCDRYTVMAIRSAVQTLFGRLNIPHSLKKLLSNLVFLNHVMTQETVYDQWLHFPMELMRFMDRTMTLDDEGRRLLETASEKAGKPVFLDRVATVASEALQKNNAGDIEDEDILVVYQYLSNESTQIYQKKADEVTQRKKAKQREREMTEREEKRQRTTPPQKKSNKRMEEYEENTPPRKRTRRTVIESDIACKTFMDDTLFGVGKEVEVLNSKPKIWKRFEVVHTSLDVKDPYITLLPLDGNKQSKNLSSSDFVAMKNSVKVNGRLWEEIVESLKE